MKYNIHNIWKGNAPPITRQKVKGERQKACSLWLAACGSETFYFELFTFSLIFKGPQLLNMRDGPRGRAPANSLAMANGLVTLNRQKSSECLYETVVPSVVTTIKPQQTQSRHRVPGVIYVLHPTKSFRMQEEEPMMEVENSKAGRIENRPQPNPDRSIGRLVMKD